MKSTPLSQVKDRFGDKTKLVSAVEALATDELWLSGKLNDDKGLAKVSNAKLLRLHGALSRTKEEFGSRAKLVQAIAELESRTKDEGYRARLGKFPTPRLLDQHDAATKRKARAANAPAPAPKKRLARTKKARVKAAG